MPHYQRAIGQISIPFTGRSPRARRTSLQGAQVCRAGSQAARLLLAYFTYGASTDLQQAERLGLPESRISARRSGLIQRHLVEYVDDVPGPFGAENGRYNVTNYGRETAGDLARAVA